MSQRPIRKSRKDIDRMRQSGDLLWRTHEMMAEHVQAGITTGELDRLAEEFIRAGGGVPTFKGYSGFPASLCTSPNAMVVHGIPGDYELRDGDLISIDCGVTLRGWVTDAARSYIVGGAGNIEGQRLVDVAYDALEAAIAECRLDRTLGDIGAAIQDVVESAGFGVIRKLVGHGVGRSMHEAPQVANYGVRGSGQRLESGWVLAIEPMITVGDYDIGEVDADGWSIYTADGSLAAHVEHTIAITDDGPLVLTRPA